MKDLKQQLEDFRALRTEGVCQTDGDELLFEEILVVAWEHGQNFLQWCEDNGQTVIIGGILKKMRATPIWQLRKAFGVRVASRTWQVSW